MARTQYGRANRTVKIIDESVYDAIIGERKLTTYDLNKNVFDYTDPFSDTQGETVWYNLLCAFIDGLDTTWSANSSSVLGECDDAEVDELTGLTAVFNGNFWRDGDIDADNERNQAFYMLRGKGNRIIVLERIAFDKKENTPFAVGDEIRLSLFITDNPRDVVASGEKVQMTQEAVFQSVVAQYKLEV